MAKIWVINGPNLNLLGAREPEIYGTNTLVDIENLLHAEARTLKHTLYFVQNNSEGLLVDAIQQAFFEKADGIIINAGAYTHTSIAIRDALQATRIPFVEVHLSNPMAREEFRQHSFLSDIAIGVISGFKADSYFLALQALHRYLIMST